MEKILDSQPVRDRSPKREIKERIENSEKVFVILATSYSKFKSIEDDSSLDKKIDELNKEREKNGESAELLQKEKELSDQLRGNLAIKNIKNLQIQGINVVLVDDGSSNEFKELTKALVQKEGGTWHEQVLSGYSQGRREGMEVAVRSMFEMDIDLDEGVLVQIEPEKVLDKELLARLINPVARGDKLMTILDRGFVVSDLEDNPEAWFLEKEGENYQGYPVFQAKSETFLNRKYTDYLCKLAGIGTFVNVYDVLNGTRVFKASLYKDFMNLLTPDMISSDFNPDKYFDAVYLTPFILAARGQFGLIEQVSFKSRNKKQFYPNFQRKLEEKSSVFIQKRNEQREQLLNEMQAAYELIASRKSDKIKQPENKAVLIDFRDFMYKKVFENSQLKELKNKVKQGYYVKTFSSSDIGGRVGYDALFRKKIPLESGIMICEFQSQVDRPYDEESKYKSYLIKLNSKADPKEIEFIMKGIISYFSVNPLAEIIIEDLDKTNFGLSFGPELSKSVSDLVTKKRIIFR